MKAVTLMVICFGAALLAACGGSNAPASSAASAAGGEHAEEHHEGVRLSEQQIDAAKIGLATAAPARIRVTLPLYGVITPNAVGVRQVTARFPGVIRAITKSIGDAARQGEVLATIESNESLQRYDVASPLTGVVTARDANLGEQSGNRTLFTVADLSSVWVELALFPRDVGKVKVGQTVRVRGAGPDATADGRVTWVAPFGSSANQTLTARVLLDNAQQRWAPGLYVSAEVTLAESEVPLAVRNGALQTLDGGPVVFVRTEQGFAPRVVQLGRSDGDNTEIANGLEAGETYAAENSFILKADLGKGEAEHED